MAKMVEDPRRSAERRRPLELFAAPRDGSTEAIMLAQGFSIEMMAELINAGFATAQTERIVAGSVQSERVLMRITDAGRRALGGITTTRLVGRDEV